MGSSAFLLEPHLHRQHKHWPVTPIGAGEPGPGGAGAARGSTQVALQNS